MNAITSEKFKASSTNSSIIHRLYSVGILSIGLLFSLASTAAEKADASSTNADLLDSAIQSAHRTTEQKARDVFRHPAETLRFFEVEPNMTVVEIWPGASGWYSAILAPYLREEGKLYAAQFNEKSEAAYFREGRKNYMEMLRDNRAVYDRVTVTTFDPPAFLTVAPAGTADRVLTFRNAHNWYMRGGGDAKILAAFTAFHRALKPGGILGVVDHRLPEDQPSSKQETSGYLHQDYVIKMAEQAGFTLVASSEINANPKDTADHAHGVWTLPPSLRVDEAEREKYSAIGESDRMTLKFVKK